MPDNLPPQNLFAEDPDPQERAKIAAGKEAIARFVRDGMKIGLGSGTTSRHFVRLLGAKVRAGLVIHATTTSRSTSAVAAKAGITIHDINDLGDLDLAIDGADEIDNRLRCIKGGGANLLWEKIVAHSAARMIVICDETKQVECLGSFPLPVEVIRFGWKRTREQITKTLAQAGISGALVCRRMRNGAPVTTDSAHYIIDCTCDRIARPEELERRLNMIPGVVENGLFTREVDTMIVAHPDRTARVITR